VIKLKCQQQIIPRWRTPIVRWLSTYVEYGVLLLKNSFGVFVRKAQNYNTEVGDWSESYDSYSRRAHELTL